LQNDSKYYKQQIMKNAHNPHLFWEKFGDEELLNAFSDLGIENYYDYQNIDSTMIQDDNDYTFYNNLENNFHD